MIENQINQAREEFAINFEAIFRDSVANALPIKLLSSSDDKLLEVVVDARGCNFVRRNYSSAMISRIQRSGIGFDRSWLEMHKIFETAGLNVVPSVVFHQSLDSKYPIVIASKLIHGIALSDASVSTKTDAATGLGNILNGSSKYLPSFETIKPNMFKVEIGTNHTENLQLIDIDPYLLSKDLISFNKSGKDIWCAAYIKRVSQLMWDFWCKPYEREEVITAFFRAITPAVKEIEGDNSQALDALMITHAMSQDINLRR